MQEGQTSMSDIGQEGMTGTTYSVSVISEKTGITPRQLYYWESIGLLSPPHLKFGRREFRRYGEKELEGLLEIKAWLEVGYTLDAVRKMRLETL